MKQNEFESASRTESQVEQPAGPSPGWPQYQTAPNAANNPDDLHVYGRVLWKRKYLIALLVSIPVLFLTINSFYVPDMYRSTAIIMPISSSKASSGGGISEIAKQFGSLAGFSLTDSQSYDIVILLNSKIFREEFIKRYNLMPVLFEGRWDEVKKDWKKGEKSGVNLNPFMFIQKVAAAIKPKTQNSRLKTQDDGSPTIWDGLRLLEGIVSITAQENGIIDVSVVFHDPDKATEIVNCLLAMLTEHVASESKRTAEVNRKYLEGKLQKTSDPFIRQKIYDLIAREFEIAMMSEVTGNNSVFKVIDPPRVPDKSIEVNRMQLVGRSFILSLLVVVSIFFFLDVYLERMKRALSEEQK